MKHLLLLTTLLLLLGPAVFGQATPASAQTTQPAPSQQQLSQPKVELYTTSWCPYCRKAKAYLQQHGISYRDYDVEKDPAAARRQQQLGGGNGVPFAIINGKKISGFSPGAYAAALGLQ